MVEAGSDSSLTGTGSESSFLVGGGFLAEAGGDGIFGSKVGGADFAFLGIDFAGGGGPARPAAVGVIKGSIGAKKECFALPWESS